MMNIPKIIYYRYGRNAIIEKLIKIYSKAYIRRLLKNKNWDILTFGKGCAIQQTTHPDVIFDYSKNEFILTVSYYPFGIEKEENSYIFTSVDGVHFTNTIIGAIETYEGNGDSHFSDGELLMDDEGYHVFYRYCERDEANQDIIIKRNSTDLKNWDNPHKIITEQKDGILSPAIIVYNDKYWMYYVRVDESCSSLWRCNSRDSCFSNYVVSKEKVSVTNIPKGYILWHVNITAINGKVYGLFTLSRGIGGKDTVLYMAKTNDDGKSWTIENRIDIGVTKIKKTYRAALVSSKNENYLYVSFCTFNDCWFTIRKKILL